MRILLLLLLLVPYFSGNGLTEFYPEKQAAKMIKIALKEKDIVLVGKIEVKENLDKPELIEIYKYRKKNQQEYYAVFTQAKGRYDNFDYLLAVNLDFEVEKIKILKYRSEYGGEIKSKKWLEQFVHYSGGELRYKKEISALSGATISAKSLTADVPKVLKILKNNCE